MNLVQLILTALACSFLLVATALAASTFILTIGIATALVLFFFVFLFLLINLDKVGGPGDLAHYLSCIIERFRL